MKYLGKLGVLLLAPVIGLISFAQVGFAQGTDPLFATAAAQSDLYEITSSKLALERSDSQAVQAFAQKMIHDHSETTAHLKPIAKAMGLTPPKQTAAVARLNIDYLTTLQGDAFDTAYLEQQTVSHEAAVGAFEIASKTAQNGELKAFAQKYLPVIQMHLKMAQQTLK